MFLKIGHRLRRRPLADPAGILAERPVAHPVQAVLDPPVAAGQPQQLPSAPARSRGRLVIPSTTSVSTFSPVLPLPRQAEDLLAAGPVRPQVLASDDVTSIDRFSIRPCPLSTSQARSISASRRAAWRGGKAGLGLGEGGRDVPGRASAGSPSPAGRNPRPLRSPPRRRRGA